MGIFLEGGGKSTGSLGGGGEVSGEVALTSESGSASGLAGSPLTPSVPLFLSDMRGLADVPSPGLGFASDFFGEWVSGGVFAAGELEPPAFFLRERRFFGLSPELLSVLDS